MPSPFFVIASSADHKLVNRVLLHLRDWDYGEDPTWDNFLLSTLTTTLPEVDGAFTKLPITASDLSHNSWRGRSIADIEAFILVEPKQKFGCLNLNTFLILDDQGAKDGTVLLLDASFSDAKEDPYDKVERFNKVRIPWDNAYITWCNLDIGNMYFSEFVEVEQGDDVEWWTYADPGGEVEQDVKEKRSNAIAELEQKGLA